MACGKNTDELCLSSWSVLFTEESVTSFSTSSVRRKISIRVASVERCECWNRCSPDEYRLISSSHEAMTDLIAVMGTLVDSQGHILIDGMYAEVATLLPEEEQLYKCITFDTVGSFAHTSLNTNGCAFRKPTALKQVWTKPFKATRSKSWCIVGDIHHCLSTVFKVGEKQMSREPDWHSSV